MDEQVGPLTDDRPVWLRQPHESKQAYAAFVAARDAGPTRSVTTVAAGLSKSRSLISRWSTHWGWVERCAAYDEHLEQARLQKVQDAVAAAGEKQARMVAAGLQVAFVLPRAVLECLQDPTQLAGLIAQAKASPRGLLQLLSEARPFLAILPGLIDTERLVLGQSTQSIDVMVEDKRVERLALSGRILANPRAVELLIGALDAVAGTGPGTEPASRG